MLKRILRSEAVAHALGGLIGAYMRLIDATTRWEFRGRETVEGFCAADRSVIVGMWHSRLMQMHKCWPSGRVLISQSREGEIVASATRGLGYGVVRGSTDKVGKSKGALAALREMLKALKQGETIALTPDGPKGPRMRVGLGPVHLARLSGAPIVAAAWSTRRALVLNSWDRLLLPLPFGRGLYAWSGPIHVPADATPAQMEDARLRLEDALNALTAHVDAWAGRPRTEPAPAARSAERVA